MTQQRVSSMNRSHIIAEVSSRMRVSASVSETNQRSSSAGPSRNGNCSIARTQVAARALRSDPRCSCGAQLDTHDGEYILDENPSATESCAVAVFGPIRLAVVEDIGASFPVAEAASGGR
jgi:hypothetical protein